MIAAAAARGLMIATAESLTGGALVSRLVDVPGASRAVAGGAVCYSFAAKHRLLGVEAELLDRTGAVTAQVAEAMARGARRAYDCDVAVATTGVAGPGPDERGVAAGTVFLAASGPGAALQVRELHLSGERGQVREAAVREALALLAEALA